MRKSKNAFSTQQCSMKTNFLNYMELFLLFLLFLLLMQNLFMVMKAGKFPDTGKAGNSWLPELEMVTHWYLENRAFQNNSH